MDRFKFRVWVNGTMCDPFSFEDIYNAAFAELKPSQVFEKYTFMQCTGLKDKNGKLVYEGDILNLEHEHDQQQGFVVGDNADSFFDDVSYLGVFDEEQREIIGNIYEHRGLLNEQGPKEG